MLRKPPNSRPTLDRCARILTHAKLAQEKEVTAHPAIEEAAKQVAELEVNKEAKQQAEQTERHKRDELLADATNELLEIRDRFFQNISNSSESVNISGGGNLMFGSARLQFLDPTPLEGYRAVLHAGGEKPYHNTGWDVLGWARIGVTCVQGPDHSPYTWSASLLFTNRNDGGGFRWYEVSFWTIGPKDRDEPFGLEGHDPDIDLALGNIMHTINVAYGPLPIDGEDEEGFISRWTDLVAKAAIGQLSSPNRMPIDFG